MILFILHIAGAAALLIWSVRLVRTGVERAFANHLLKDTALGRGLVKMASDDQEIEKTRGTKHFGKILVQIGIGRHAGRAAEASRKARCLFSPGRFWIPKVNE